MTRKEVLKSIQELGPIKPLALMEILNCETKTQKKQASRIIQDYIDHKVLRFDLVTGMIELNKPGKQEKKVKEDKPWKKKPEQQTKPPLKKEKKGQAPDALEDFGRIVEKYEIRKEFPSKVMAEAENINAIIPPQEISRRLDLRNDMVITIDGADAKDLDDAVSIEKTRQGWLLGVHIADVSWYVPKDSFLDREANKRANSFYFVNKVIPMFPKILSNGICSLNPEEDRLTMSAFMEIDKNGNVLKYSLHESVIHSRHRLTYDSVQQHLDGKEVFTDKELIQSMALMNDLFRVLKSKRIADGAIDFDFREQKVVLNEDDEPEKLYLKDRQDSERLIEEFMLIANQCVAKYLSGFKAGRSLFRIHAEPDESKMQDFVRVALKCGYKIRGVPVPDPLELQKILEEAKDKPHKDMINQILLRSMQQAKYDTDNIGHYGLGFEFYTHFTSPIRRYADLIVHRLIRHILQGNTSKALYAEDNLNEIAVHISSMERVAMEAERDFYKIKAIRFMDGREGKDYPGIITGVSSFGIFVQIQKYGVEGLVRFMDMDDDYYVYDEQNYCAVGRRHKKTYTMGDAVKVKVMRVNIERGFLDLEFTEAL